MSGESVKVVVRCRPMNQREKDLKCDNIVKIDSQQNTAQLICPAEPDQPAKSFAFDGAYGIDSNTETIYGDVGFPLVESVCEGYNGTVFAYGQTGCGKSFTMQGNSAQKGMIPRAFEHVFEAVSTDTSKKYLIRASYLEIYNENVRDLLGKDIKSSLDLHEHPEKGVYVSNLSWHECKQVVDCDKLMDKGNKNRSVGATLMNADSSRSHSIFTINVEMCEKDNDGEEHYRAGKLNLVDLAGSERQSKTGATGDRLKEATKINLSLSALGNVISALVDGKSKHVPYRDSKLTRLLQDSLGGNTKTLMIAALSPAADNYEETLSTLRYANRAKNIKNKPKINEDPKDAMLRELQEEIKILKLQLAGKEPIQAVTTNNAMSTEQIEYEKEKLREEFENKIHELQNQYEEEKMSKEALMKKMDAIKNQYDNQINLLDENSPNKIRPPKPKSSKNKKQKKTTENGETVDLTDSSQNMSESNDPEQRLHKLEEMVVGGEQANNEELKKKRIKKKKYAEERKRLADSLKKGEDDEFMLRVYDNVQEEVQYKTKLLEKEKEKTKFLQNEVDDLQREFEREREEYLDTIRKQEKQIKLLSKLNQKIQPLIPHDCNYYNMDKIQMIAIWSEEIQDWILPDLKREKLSLPSMASNENDLDITNGQLEYYESNGFSQIPQQQVLLQSRKQESFSQFMPSREPEIDRYRLKLENSQFDGASYFKNKRQSELLSQTQDLKSNGRLSPISSSKNGSRRFY